jgi:hypothetical protein
VSLAARPDPVKSRHHTGVAPASPASSAGTPGNVQEPALVDWGFVVAQAMGPESGAAGGAARELEHPSAPSASARAPPRSAGVPITTCNRMRRGYHASAEPSLGGPCATLGTPWLPLPTGPAGIRRGVGRAGCGAGRRGHTSYGAKKPSSFLREVGRSEFGNRSRSLGAFARDAMLARKWAARPITSPSIS